MWKYRHRHLSISIVTRVGIDIGIAKSLYLPSEIFFKNRIFMSLLVLNYGINTTLLKIPISRPFPIHESKGVHWCSRKRQFELSEASIHCILKKSLLQTFLHTLHTFERNIHDGVLFTYTRWSSGIFPKSSLEQLFCRVYVCLLAPASVTRNSTAHIISGIFQNFKNMQGIRLQAVN